MKCKECSACRKGWFPSKPNDYICIGVSEPFVISNINAECTEYDEYEEVVTNADNIRSMSDEELTALLAKGIYNNKEIDVDYEICHKGMCLDDETCVSCMLKWLKKPMVKE